jgi:hypothetical protein
MHELAPPRFKKKRMVQYISTTITMKAMTEKHYDRGNLIDKKTAPKNYQHCKKAHERSKYHFRIADPYLNFF